MQDGINWNTPSLETGACIGLYLDGEAMLADIGTKGVQPTKKNIDKWKKKIKSVLGNGQDWDKRGVASIEQWVDSISVMDMNVWHVLLLE